MGPSKLKVLANILTTFGIFGPVVAGILQLIIGSPAIGVTMYGPYSSVGVIEKQVSFVGLGFLFVLVISNLMVTWGIRGLFVALRKARLVLSLGILIPVILEVLGLLRSTALSQASADMPRRYHYYYFVPSPKTPIQTVWDFFTSNTLWPVALHVGCLVLLLSGYALATRDAASE